MCAVYAFMRWADDLADDESLTVEARRGAMAEWLAKWRAARVGGATEDPVFLALGEAQRRFGIKDELLEELVRGTTLDLEEHAAGVTPVRVRREDPGESEQLYQVYESFEGLYRYCYLVASVVGLVCIQVFGYREAAARKLAEETGIAFQLTNILRDVREDADRGRVYVPMDDMTAAGFGVDEVLHTLRGETGARELTALLEMEGLRAQGYYGSADRLLPMIDRDSRAALWVMVTIYRELLERIAAGGYDVTRRVSVPTWRKLAILGQGMGMAAWLRVTG